MVDKITLFVEDKAAYGAGLYLHGIGVCQGLTLQDKLQNDNWIHVGDAN